jgi:outer membrane protein assembly factor BamB
LKIVSKRVFVTVGALLLLLMAACVPQPIDTNWAHLSVINGQIVMPFHDRLALINPTNGQAAELRDAQGQVRRDDQGNPRTWQVTNPGGTCAPTGPNCFYATPIQLDEDTLLAASYNKKLYEVDVEAARIDDTNGWTVDGHIVGNPITYNDMLIVPLGEQDVVALNLETQETVWRFDTERGVWAQPLLVENTLYVSSMDHNLYAINADTGAELWRLALDGAVASTPLFHDGLLYIGSFGGKVYQINPNGEITAQFDGITEWVWGTPVIDDNILYTADTGGNVYALEIGSGSFTQLWARKVAERAIRATPLIVGDRLVVGSRDSNLYWINRSDGTEVYRRPLQGEMLADPLLLEPSETVDIDEPLIIVSTMARNRAVIAYTLENVERWAFAF